MKHSLKFSLLHALAAAMLVVMPMQQAQSAPGTLPTTPLFLSTIVEPNVFLTLDDSTSMRWEVNVSAGIGLNDNFTTEPNWQGLPVIPWDTALGGQLRAYIHPAYFNPNVVPPVEFYPEAWVLKTHAGNTTYYNPDTTYIPWPGTDASGNALYPEYPYTGPAPLFPNDPTAVYNYSTYKLTDVFPYNDGYTDIDGDLVADTGKIYLPTYYVWDDTNTAIPGIDTLDAHTEVQITTADELQNFTNWFVYYRTREYVTKATIGKVINNSDSNRMGFSLFNGGHQIDTATMTDQANKLALLKTFYNTTSSGTTPARTALEKVGLMFASDSVTPTPILPAVDGGTCQQNFNLLMTDGYWNGPGPTWGTKKPGDTNNTDTNSGVAVSAYDGDADESNDGGNYADSYIDTLADVAMHYYENDLDPAMLNEVSPQPGVDEATHQHLVNYVLSFGLEGSLDSTKQDPTDIGFAWPDPYAGFDEKIDDLWHAAYNSRGKFLSTNDIVGLESGLNLAIANISERTGTAAAVAVNSAQLSTESVVYLAQFNTNRWQGNLYAFPIIDTDTGELSTTDKWGGSGAAPKLTLRQDGSASGNPRTIITYDKDLTSASKGVAFRWDTSVSSTAISAVMKKDFLTNPLGGLDADTGISGIGSERLDYIRGDRSHESFGYGFRERLSLLGDLVHSGPVFVGTPNLAWPDFAPFPTGTEAYSKFKLLYENRTKMVYVGANDGMLHAFDDRNGEEVFGYVPGSVYSQTVNSGLHYLSDPNYIHNYYVDLSPTASDVYFNSNWHSILVGGLRGGGRGIFALDITNPAAFSEANAAKMSLWEFTSDDDADLGYTFSRPTIGLSNAGTWVAIFGNGYNQAATGSGEAALFIVDIERGLDGSWAQVGDYKKITTGVGTPGAQNGLATPALADLDGNGTIDRVYAGDLEGNMWVFDLSGNVASKWDIPWHAGSAPIPLFTTPAGQPITAKPVLASHPTQPFSQNPSNAPNIMVYFGTGQYLVSGDKVTTDTQSFYGVWDHTAFAMTQADLIEQTFDPSFTGRVLTRNAVDYSIDDGWFFNLTDSGERVVTSPIARADTVFFNTFVPEDDPCSQGGYGYRFAVDMATGGSPLEPTIDNNDDGVVDDNDYVNNGNDDGVIAAVRQEGFLPEPVFIEDLAFTGEVGSKIKSLSNVPSGRFSWQELLL
jgi:type IV pilus assembly protein PilY1